MRLDRKKLMLVMYDKNITQIKLAEASGVSRATVNSVRGGKSCSEETANKIAQALNVNLKEILE